LLAGEFIGDGEIARCFFRRTFARTPLRVKMFCNNSTHMHRMEHNITHNRTLSTRIACLGDETLYRQGQFVRIT